MSNDPAMMFIDGQNLFHGAMGYGIEYDYNKVRAELGEEYDLLGSYWFDAKEPGDQGKQGFLTSVEGDGFRVEDFILRDRDIDRECPQCGYEHSDSHKVTKGVDVSLATEMLQLAHNDAYETAILVSGDEDYIQTIRYVQNQGKRVIVAAFEDSIRRNVKKTANDYICLDDLASEIARD